MSNTSYWSFTYFTSDVFKYRESWERDNPILRNELLYIAHNYDPCYGYRHLTRNSTNFGSQNSWYSYMRHIKTTEEGVYDSWTIEVHPTAENPNKPFHRPHHVFEIMMPEEFLNDEIFMELNTRPYEESKELPSFLVGANITS